MSKLKIIAYNLLAVLLVFTLFCNVWIVGSTRHLIVTPEELPPGHRVVLVLGTSAKTHKGGDNRFFSERMSTAAALYKAGKADRIILSGDHITKYYDEPEAMRIALQALGVPDSVLLSDDGGARTIDSVIRCKQVFGQDSVVIVTQRFHAYRALFISRMLGVNALAVATREIEGQAVSGVLLREFFARPKAIIDLFFWRLTGKQ